MNDPTNFWLSLCLQLAKTAQTNGEVPIGAAIVKNNTLISTGFNLKETNNDPMGHAELVAIRRATKVLNRWRLHDCEIYISLEPCTMCCGAILESRLSSVTFATRDHKRGGLSLFELNNVKSLNHRFAVSSEPIIEQKDSFKNFASILSNPVLLFTFKFLSSL